MSLFTVLDFKLGEKNGRSDCTRYISRLSHSCVKSVINHPWLIVHTNLFVKKNNEAGLPLGLPPHDMCCFPNIGPFWYTPTDSGNICWLRINMSNRLMILMIMVSPISNPCTRELADDFTTYSQPVSEHPGC